MIKDNLFKMAVAIVVVLGCWYFFKLVPGSYEFTSSKSNLSLKSNVQRSLSSLPFPIKDIQPKSSNLTKLDNQQIEEIISDLSRKRVVVNERETSHDLIDRVLRVPSQRALEKSWVQASRSFRTLPGIRAVPSDQIPSQLPAESKLLSFLEYTLVQTSNSEFENTGLPVVYDTQRGTLGVITGTLTVSYKKGFDSLQNIPPGLTLIQNFPQLGMATLSSSSLMFDGLMNSVQSLKLRPEVQDVVIEVTESRFTTN